jgi:tetratricopeptide (TPR) repeat protein
MLVYSLDSHTVLAASCAASSGAEAVVACEQELVRHPDSDELRLHYAEALMNQRRYREAVNVLREGLVMHPGSSSLKQKYRMAASLADEQEVINHLNIQTPAPGTRRNVNEILCTTLKGERALDACTKVLKADPRNVAALSRQGDELMAMQRIEEAVSSYRRAVVLEPTDRTLMAKLQSAESKLPAAEAADVVVAQQGAEATRLSITASQPDSKRRPARPSSQAENSGADVPSVAVTRPATPEIAQTAMVRQKISERAPPPSLSMQKMAPNTERRFINAPVSPGVTF